MQQEIKKTHRKILFVDYNKLTQEEIILTRKEIRKRLKAIFASHIGKNNAINPVELFFKIFGRNPLELGIFERTYFWNIVKKILRDLRTEEELFVVQRGNSYFVLCNEEELRYYKFRNAQHIDAINNLSKKAESWVKNSKWKTLIGQQK